MGMDDLPLFGAISKLRRMGEFADLDYPAVCANQCPENHLGARVEVYEDINKLFHYQAREVGVKNQNSSPTLCGLPVLDMRKAAWFDVGDRRGKVHFDRACEECRRRLVF